MVEAARSRDLPLELVVASLVRKRLKSSDLRNESGSGPLCISSGHQGEATAMFEPTPKKPARRRR